MTTVLTAANEDAGTRLDAFLAARLPELSRSRAASLVQEGRVTVNGRPASKSCRLTGGETLSVDLPEQPADASLTAQAIPTALLTGPSFVAYQAWPDSVKTWLRMPVLRSHRSALPENRRKYPLPLE